MIVEHWRTVPLGDVLVERNERRGDRDLPVLSVTKNKGIMLASERFGRQMHGRDLTNYRIAPRDSIVLDPMLLWSGTIGRQKAVDEGVVSPDYRVYDVRGDVEVPFLEHAVQGAQLLTQFQLAARGTNVRRNRIARSDFLTLRLDLPPATEQRKIAAILSAVDEAIEKTQAMIDQVQIVKKALMTELLTRGLPGRHKRFKKTELGEIPEDWEVGSVADVVETCDYGLNSALTTDRSGLPVLRMGNLQRGRVLLEDLKYLAHERFDRPDLLLKRGDVLFNRTNSADLVGKVGIFDGSTKASFASYLLRMRPRLPHSSRWLNHLLNADEQQRSLRALATRGVSQANINRTKLLALPIRIPPATEQREIATAIDSMERRVEIEEVGQRAQRHLKHALASVLLTGELRVTPDPVP